MIALVGLTGQHRILTLGKPFEFTMPREQPVSTLSGSDVSRRNSNGSVTDARLQPLPLLTSYEFGRIRRNLADGLGASQTQRPRYRTW